MKFEIVKEEGGEHHGQPVASVTHGRKPALKWSIAIYTKSHSQQDKEKSKDYDIQKIFNELNQYVAKLSTVEQDALYALYEEARVIQSDGHDILKMSELLQDVAKRIYEIVRYEGLREWVDNESGLVIPDGIKQYHGPSDPRDQLYLDRTYLEDDYRGLVSLGIGVRAMYPIWGEFLRVAKSRSGNAQKEYEGLRLLYHTSLTQSPAMQRLERYIETTTRESQRGGPSAASIMGGAGTTTLPEIVHAVTVVRRLAGCPLISKDGSVNVITNVYQFVQYNLRGTDRKFGSRYGANITDTADAANSREDNNDSRMELLRIKEDVPAAVGAKINSYAENLQNMVLYIDPTIPEELVNKCAQALANVSWKTYQPVQINLMQLVAGSCIAREHPTISPRGLPLMQLKAQHSVATVVQAALWHWGFFELAALLTAEVVEQSSELLGSSEPLRFPRGTSVPLDSLFPYVRKISRAQQTVKHDNVGRRGVEMFTVAARRPIWRIHAPFALAEKLQMPQQTANYEFVASIRDELTDLLVKINR